MLKGGDESNCKRKIAASVGTELTGWRRGLDRLACLALVASLNIIFSIYLENLPSTAIVISHLADSIPSPPGKRKVRRAKLTVFTSQHPQRILQTSPCRGR